MTPFRDRQRGTLILDRQFRGVGRLKRASGTQDTRLFKLMDAMLTTLHKNGRIDILQAIRSGVLTPLEVWSRYRLNELDRLPTAETIRTLDPHVYEWLPTYECGEDHRAGLLYAWRGILRVARKDATVADLPTLLRSIRRDPTGKRMFNRMRSAVQAYLGDTLGSGHPLYARVTEIKPFKVTRKDGNPQEPAAIRDLVATMGDEGPMVWSMASTGMGPKEYWGRWNVQADRVHIVGTKRKGRVRDIPRIGAVTPATVSYPTFRKRLLFASTGILDPKEAAQSRLAVSPYDLRRTFSHWMEEAGIPRTRRKLYLGHGTQDVTDLYERHEVAAFLADDGAKLRHYLGVGDPPQMRLVKTGKAG